MIVIGAMVPLPCSSTLLPVMDGGLSSRLEVSELDSDWELLAGIKGGGESESESESESEPESESELVGLCEEALGVFVRGGRVCGFFSSVVGGFVGTDLPVGGRPYRQ